MRRDKPKRLRGFSEDIAPHGSPCALRVDETSRPLEDRPSKLPQRFKRQIEQLLGVPLPLDLRGLSEALGLRGKLSTQFVTGNVWCIAE